MQYINMHNVPQKQDEDHKNINQGSEPEILEICIFFPISLQTLFLSIARQLSKLNIIVFNNLVKLQ